MNFIEQTIKDAANRQLERETASVTMDEYERRKQECIAKWQLRIPTPREVAL